MAEKYLTITALTRYLKQKFDRDPYLQEVYLTGEISNFRLRPAHQYFSLKDDQAKIKCIMFKNAFQKVKFQPQEGQKVLVVGRISLYEATGEYQIYVEKMEPDGVGALYQAFKELQQKLYHEGLFTAPKKALPRFPKRIGVLTSPSGAVIRDIITTVKRRYPIAEIVLFPSLVQGDQAAKDLVKNLELADKMNFDTIIIGRGGGSIEDLWPFNEEVLARSIFAAKTPIISSVGHETDTTIADLVADVRAATPTAAAELAVPELTKELQRLQEYQQRLYNQMQMMLKQQQERVNKLEKSYVFRQPNRLYDGLMLKVDMLSQQLASQFQGQVKQKERSYRLLQERFQQLDVSYRVDKEQQNLAYLKQQLNQFAQLTYEKKAQDFQHIIASLNLLSPLNILERGYSYTLQEGRIIKDSQQLNKDEDVKIQLAKGSFIAKVTEIKGE